MNSCHMACIPKRKYCNLSLITWPINKRKFIEVSVMSHEVLQLLVNLVVTWHGMACQHH